MENHSTLNCSGTMTEILLEGVREMIGTTAKIANFDSYQNLIDTKNISTERSELNSLTEDELKNLLESAPILYGERGASGIAQRVGENSFRCFLRKQGKEYLLTDNSYRLMNSQQRINFGLNQLGKFAYQNCGVDIKISEEEQSWLWEVQLNKENQNWICLFVSYTLGLLREFFSWTSGGKYYPMEEVLLSAEGNPVYRIAISKQPLGN
jgi:hypothetical protein